MGNTASSTEHFNYSSILDETEDLAKGLGAIHRHYDCHDGLKKKFDDNINSLYDVFVRSSQLYPNNLCYGYRPIVDNVAQDFEWFTFSEINEMINKYAKGIEKLGLLGEIIDGDTLPNGNHIRPLGHYQKNCYELCVSQFAVWKLAGTVIPIYDTFGTEAVSFMVHQTNLKTIFCSLDKAFILLNNIESFTDNYSSLKNIIVREDLTDELKELARVHDIQLFTFKQILELGSTVETEPSASVHEDDYCMLMYTSGTTGVPKAVKVSHLMLISEATSCIDHITRTQIWGPDDCYLSYLPMAHIFEHFVQTTLMIVGAHIGFYQGSPSLLTDDLCHLHPTLFASVPRLYGKIVDTIIKKANNSGTLVSTLFNYALECKKYNLLHYNTVVSSIWDPLVFKTIKEKCGLDHVKFMLSGSAPIPYDCMLNLRCIFGASVCQGFGMTETAGGLCCVSLDDMNTFNHCGGPIITAEARLVSVPDMNYLITDRYHNRIVETREDGTENVINEGIPCLGRGEIVFRGYNITKGYFNNSQLTSITIDKDGWFHSGDIGIWTMNGCLQIVDKIKALFKLSQGEYISPDRIQGVYLSCPFVSNIFVYGDSYQSFLIAIVVPDEDVLRRYIDSNHLDITGSFEEICSLQEVKDIIFKELKKTDEHSTLMSFEKVKNIYVSPEKWTIENNMLTPTMKIKRETGQKKYNTFITQLYKEGIYKIKN